MLERLFGEVSPVPSCRNTLSEAEASGQPGVAFGLLRSIVHDNADDRGSGRSRLTFVLGGAGSASRSLGEQTLQLRLGGVVAAFASAR
jgi:hypothetical protein